jgi:hypothetical protein
MRKPRTVVADLLVVMALLTAAPTAAQVTTGTLNVEFRWDAFNLFNHPGFGFPNQNFDSPTAGRITSTVVDNRSMQFSLKMNF